MNNSRELALGPAEKPGSSPSADRCPVTRSVSFQASVHTLERATQLGRFKDGKGLSGRQKHRINRMQALLKLIICAQVSLHLVSISDLVIASEMGTNRISLQRDHDGLLIVADGPADRVSRLFLFFKTDMAEIWKLIEIEMAPADIYACDRKPSE